MRHKDPRQMELTFPDNGVGKLAREMRTQYPLKSAALVQDYMAIVVNSIPGRTERGRGENGKRFDTKPLEALKITVFPEPPGRVEMILTKREKKAGEDPTRREEEHNSDVFRAVRSRKHARESYEQEDERRSAALELAERINADLYVNWRAMGEDEYKAKVERIIEILEGTKLERNATKVDAKERLAKAMVCLKEMLKAEVLDRGMVNGRACALVASFRTRYGKWRTTENARIIARTLLKESALRAERDKMLVRLLFTWTHDIEAYGYAVAEVWKRDTRRCSAIGAIKFAIGYEDAKDTRKKIEELGRGFKDYSYEGIAKQHLRNAWAAMRNGKAAEANEELENARRELEKTKPWRIAEELEKTRDPYMEITVKRIKTAVEILMLYEPPNIERPPKLFRETAKALILLNQVEEEMHDNFPREGI